VALLGALLLSGCGRGADEDSARSVAEGFYSAVAAGDGQRACSELGSDTLTELEKQEGKPCPQAVLELKLSGSKAAGESVYLTSASVRLARGDTVFLDEGPDGWKVSAVGCKPMGRPSEEPYDCEVES
jgi:hypothetical protein